MGKGIGSPNSGPSTASTHTATVGRVTTDIFILGGSQTDFARNYAKQGLEISDLVADVVAGTLASAQVEPADIETIHVAATTAHWPVCRPPRRRPGR